MFVCLSSSFFIPTTSGSTTFIRKSTAVFCLSLWSRLWFCVTHPGAAAAPSFHSGVCKRRQHVTHAHGSSLSPCCRCGAPAPVSLCARSTATSEGLRVCSTGTDWWSVARPTTPSGRSAAWTWWDLGNRNLNVRVLKGLVAD